VGGPFAFSPSVESLPRNHATVRVAGNEDQRPVAASGVAACDNLEEEAVREPNGTRRPVLV